MNNAKSVQPVPNTENVPTQAELDAMPAFERFKWITRHVLSAPKDAVTNPFTKHQKTGPNKPPRTPK